MKNWRKILVTGMVAGMVMVTGCSSNLPETNQGNRNGQRVVDAVNRRTDTYGVTRSYNTGARTIRGFNRGFRRAARHDNARYDGRIGTRHYNHIAHQGLRADGGTNYRHPGLGTGTTRNIPNRNTNTFNRGTVGHTFGYGSYGYDSAVDGEYDGGYDLGQRAGTRTSTAQNNTLNNRVVRSTSGTATPNRTATAGISHKTATNKTGVTRSTGNRRNTTTHNTNTVAPARTKSVQPIHKSTHNTPPTRNTQPMLHNTTNNTGVVHNTTPTRSITNRQGTRKLSARADKARSLHQNTRAMHSQNNNVAQVAPIMNTNPIVNPSATRGITRARSYQNRQNRAGRRAASRRVANNDTRRFSSNRPYNVNMTDYSLNNHGFNDGMYLGADYYMNNNDAYDMHGRNSYATGHSVPASADDSNDLAFFKRDKTNNDEVPATPNGPQAPIPTNRANPEPVPVPTPAPTGMSDDFSWDYDNNNIHDLDDMSDSGYNNNDYNNNDYVNPVRASDTVNNPTHRAGHRVMK